MELRVEVDAHNVPYIQLGKHQLRLDLEDLDETYRERAKNELRDTPEVVQDALCQLKDYILGEPGLHVPFDDKKFLMKFLRPFRFNPKNAFRVMKKFYQFKLKNPKYGLLTPHMVRHVFDREVLKFLPTRTSSGSRLLVVNAGKKWEPKFVSTQDILKAVIVAIEIAMMEPKTQVAGVHVIINMEGFTLTHVCQFSPSLAKLYIDWIQECAPVRLMGIHFINQSFFFNMVFSIFKPFMGEELKRKLYFHGSNTDSLCEKVSKEALPKSLGGSEAELDFPGHLISDILFYYEKTFEEHNSYRYITEK